MSETRLGLTNTDDLDWFGLTALNYCKYLNQNPHVHVTNDIHTMHKFYHNRDHFFIFHFPGVWLGLDRISRLKDHQNEKETNQNFK